MSHPRETGIREMPTRGDAPRRPPILGRGMETGGRPSCERAGAASRRPSKASERERRRSAEDDQRRRGDGEEEEREEEPGRDRPPPLVPGAVPGGDIEPAGRDER